jgi:hypothetical protein
MKPQFLFIGPHKSGTTWIDNYLRTRSDVVLPKLAKETFFFDKLYERGMSWYEEQFGTPAAGAVCVEVAPSLLAKHEAAERVARNLPNVTVICTLRHPIERAIAHYFHHLKGGEADVGFAAMAQKHPEILDIGFYYRHLRRWEELLGRERLRLIDYETLCTRPEEYCAQICSLLGIPYQTPAPEVLYARVNEDGSPDYRLLAKFARGTAEKLRHIGAHQVVNFLRTPGIRRLTYGAAPDAGRRAAIRAQAIKYQDIYVGDIEMLRQHFGADITHWKQTEDVE